METQISFLAYLIIYILKGIGENVYFVFNFKCSRHFNNNIEHKYKKLHRGFNLCAASKDLTII